MRGRVKREAPVAAKLLVIIDEVGSSYFSRILEEDRKQVLVITDGAQLVDHLSKLADLSHEGRLSVVKRRSARS